MQGGCAAGRAGGTRKTPAGRCRSTAATIRVGAGLVQVAGAAARATKPRIQTIGARRGQLLGHRAARATNREIQQTQGHLALLY